MSVLQKKIVSCHTADSKPVKKEVDGTVILPPLVFIPWPKKLVRDTSEVKNEVNVIKLFILLTVTLNK